MTRRLLTCALLLIALAPIARVHPRAAAQLDREDVIFYPTYGFTQGSTWIVPMRAKVQEARVNAARFSTLFGKLQSPGAAETALFKARIADFFADDEHGEDVRLRFDGDPDQRDYRIADARGGFPETDANGMVEGTMTLTEAVAQALLARQGSTDGWLTYHAVSRDHTGTGRIRLIGPTGVSVVSDIDDTIKISEVPAGPRILVTNTFYREFVPVEEMRTKYRALGDAAFHYVSGGPWQMYRPLSAFLIDGRHFPEGTFHMKTLRGGIRTPVTSLEDLHKFIAPGGTFEHKVEQITTLMERFPGRKFILVGDSGEQDPEVYRTVQGRFGSQVQEIIIRDLVNARQLTPARLTGMTIVEAPTVVKGVSQFAHR